MTADGVEMGLVDRVLEAPNGLDPLVDCVHGVDTDALSFHGALSLVVQGGDARRAFDRRPPVTAECLQLDFAEEEDSSRAENSLDFVQQTAYIPNLIVSRLEMSKAVDDRLHGRPHHEHERRHMKLPHS